MKCIILILNRIFSTTLGLYYNLQYVRRPRPTIVSLVSIYEYHLTVEEMISNLSTTM